MSEQRRPGKYLDELRERAVRMVFEAEGHCASRWEAISSVAEMYWTPDQQLAHMTINGARLRPGTSTPPERSRVLSGTNAVR